jgi:hypothetical protein
MQSDKYQRRFLKTTNEGDDEVSKYKAAISTLQEYIQDVRQQPSTRNEGFIVIHFNLLKGELIQQGYHRIQTLFQSFIDASKTELYSFLQELKDIVEELKTPCTSDEQLRHIREME